MKAMTKTAQRLLPFFKALALRAGVHTDKVRVSVSKRHALPYACWDTIRLPDLEDDPRLYVKTFLHELQHVRDILSGEGGVLSRDEMEARAQIAEQALTPDVTEAVMREFFPTARIYHEQY